MQEASIPFGHDDRLNIRACNVKRVLNSREAALSGILFNQYVRRDISKFYSGAISRIVGVQGIKYLIAMLIKERVGREEARDTRRDKPER